MQHMTPKDIRLARAAHRAKSLQPASARAIARVVASRKQWLPRWEIEAGHKVHDGRKR